MLTNRETRVVDIDNVVSDLASLDDSANEQRILTSERLLKSVIQRLRLDRDPEFNRALRPPNLLLDWRREMEAAFADGYLAPLLAPRTRIPDAALQSERERLEILRAVRAALKVDGIQYTRAITIEVTSTDAAKAALIANTLADLYIFDQLEDKFEATRRASAWLSERIAELKAKVRDSEAAVESFKANQAIGPGQGAALTDLQIAELNTELIAARAASAEAEARFNQVDGRLTNGGLDAAARVVSSPLVLTLRTRLAELKRQAVELSTRYGEKHPQMINIRAEVADARDGVAAEVRKIVDGLKNDLAIAQARERALETSLTALEDKSVQLSQSSVQLRQLEREAEADRVIYQTFLNRFRETSEQEDLQAADARLLSSATPPLIPSAPNRKKILVVAATMGIGLGLTLVVILERLASSYRTVREIATDTALPVLTALPRWRRNSTRRQALDYLRKKPNSSLAEATRTLRTALLLSQIDNPPGVVMVTSSGPEDGKSTTCLLLAQMAANAGQKVIVVDCDIRRPTLHETFGIKRKNGLLAVLNAAVGLEEAIIHDQITGLDLLTSPKPFPQAADVFTSTKFANLINTLRADYDLVVLDTPPIMLVPDASAIAPLADATLYAVRYDHTPRAAVRNGIARLQALGAKLSGCVVTLVDRRKEARYADATQGVGHGAYSNNTLYYVD